MTSVKATGVLAAPAVMPPGRSMPAPSASRPRSRRRIRKGDAEWLMGRRSRGVQRIDQADAGQLKSALHPEPEVALRSEWLVQTANLLAVDPADAVQPVPRAVRAVWRRRIEVEAQLPGDVEADAVIRVAPVAEGIRGMARRKEHASRQCRRAEWR